MGLEGNSSFSLNNPDPSDPLFHVCWGRQLCSSCLIDDVSCSWCAISSTCVPNPSRFPIFAPFGSATICPLGSKKRWELRAPPFGCHASTLTVMSVTGAVLATVALGAVGVGLVWLIRWTRWRRKGAKHGQSDEEEEGPSRWRDWNSGFALSAGLFSHWRRIECVTEECVTEIEEREGEETRPLL
ncbi:uncharacterized protein N7479_009320 [Penicillium vulpinum]|uniref:uncharacterized protein n=1 Tax=Penicillium vulpinum TaxID=29845 RepID=UPI002547F250|nr:uncharacterized protein N7479_009320 [Penicillium vulpinum]KAJ5950907.1 hypothetical protein N7479_009320 [Penicillium vulpinum]